MKLLRQLAAITILSAFLGCSKSSSDVNNNPANPLPVIVSISPNAATTGSPAFTITVTGTNFINGSVIKWNNNTLATTYVSTTQLSANVPAVNISIADTAAVTVSTASPGGGTSAALNFSINNSTVNNPVPTLSGLSPNSATAGGSSFILTANGANFVNGTLIKWNGISLTTTYVNAMQLTAAVPAANISTTGTASITLFSPTPGGGNSLSLDFNITTSITTKRFLFDATHGETAGNADWVIDEDGAAPQSIPTPAQSTVIAATAEDYWTGALSSWGIALAKHGYAVETLPAGNAITYGNSSNPQDLSNYDVFVVDEPNNVFTAAEKTAILNFINNGGGLFMVSDHTGSDRDFDGWDSPAIWNDLMTNNSVQTNPFGFSIDLATFSETTSNVLTSSSSPILSGSQGNVSQLQYSSGTSATINTSVNPTVKGLIWKSTATQNNNNVMCLSSTYGTGRIFFIGDSSPLDDGTGGAGNTLYTSWPSFSHSQLFMNASLWLSKEQ